MKSRTIGTIMGLTALLGGCDENQEKVLYICDAGGIQVRAVYHQRRLGDKVYTPTESHYHPTLKFYKDNKIIASVKLELTPNDNWIQCDNGQKLNLELGSKDVYFSNSEVNK